MGGNSKPAPPRPTTNPPTRPATPPTRLTRLIAPAPGQRIAHWALSPGTSYVASSCTASSCGFKRSANCTSVYGPCAGSKARCVCAGRAGREQQGSKNSSSRMSCTSAQTPGSGPQTAARHRTGARNGPPSARLILRTARRFRSSALPSLPNAPCRRKSQPGHRGASACLGATPSGPAAAATPSRIWACNCWPATRRLRLGLPGSAGACLGAAA